jgi:predicted DNA-binding transcriptional regulator YafY
MNRIDRLFAISVVLQARRQVRAADLAALFEVSERTIYRDIEALNESGIPVVAIPGKGYELVEDFYLPTVQLTLEEAKALFLAAEMLKSQTGGALAGQVERALAKLAAALPETTATEAARLAELLRFSTQPGRLDLDDPRLRVLQQAVRERRVVWLRYHSYTQDAATEREIEPEGLQYTDGAWYISSYCRLRRGPRSFRLSRIEDLQLMAETFQPRTMLHPPQPLVEIRVRFERQIVRWVRERQHYGFASEADDGQGVVMTYCVENLSELRPWVLSWGAAAEVMAPPEARAEMQREVRRMLRE